MQTIMSDDADDTPEMVCGTIGQRSCCPSLRALLLRKPGRLELGCLIAALDVVLPTTTFLTVPSTKGILRNVSPR
jgi:hypothetical protein